MGEIFSGCYWRSSGCQTLPVLVWRCLSSAFHARTTQVKPSVAHLPCSFPIWHISRNDFRWALHPNCPIPICFHLYFLKRKILMEWKYFLTRPVDMKTNFFLLIVSPLWVNKCLLMFVLSEMLLKLIRTYWELAHEELDDLQTVLAMVSGTKRRVKLATKAALASSFLSSEASPTVKWDAHTQSHRQWKTGKFW